MATFNYNLNVPNGPNNPSADQPLLQTNTNSINSLIAVDHYTFGTGLDGYHEQVTIGQTLSSAPSLGTGTAVFYGGLNGGNCWPHWVNSAGNVLMLNGVPSAMATGYTFLPGGIIMQWGLSATTGPVSFPKTFTTVFSVVVSPSIVGATTANPIFSSTAVGTGGFTIATNGSGSAAGYNIYWTAIGN